VLALTERGHRLTGLWTIQGRGDATVGPLPFGHVPDLDRDRWLQEVRALRPDVVWAQLNWRAVPLAHAVRTALPELPFVWTFKESPQRSVVRGEWPLLADLMAGADACLLATGEERDWFTLACMAGWTGSGSASWTVTCPCGTGSTLRSPRSCPMPTVGRTPPSSGARPDSTWTESWP
jgi:hypothetical protein